MSEKLFDAQRQPVVLEPEFARGGEGTVHRVRGMPGVVAKVYHQHVPPTKAAKLQLMVQLLTPSVERVAAWPSGVLLNGNGALRGLLMPHVEGALESHAVYSTKSRLQHFPRADWLFLVRVARNTAAAVAALHAAGHVIGDVNQKGVLVAKDTTVRLIDCDSFQITSGNAQHLCGVGVAEFVPPELSGKNFAHTRRTANHDAFGLAVLLFHFLFLGRHPFAGRFSGPLGTEMSVEQAIREYRFAYSSEAAAKQMAPPPGALPLHFASPLIAGLFERAFSEAGARGGRPSAVEWVQALDVLSAELVRCGSDAHHSYHPSFGSCPWCAMEAVGGVTYFTPAPKAGASTRYDHVEMERLWRVLQLPKPVPEFPVQVPTDLKGRPVPWRQRVREPILVGLLSVGYYSIVYALIAASVGTAAVGAVVIGFFWLLTRIKTRKSTAQDIFNRRTELGHAQIAWDYAVTQWKETRDVLWQQFDDAQDTMEAMLEHVRNVRSDRSGAEARLCLDYAMAKEKVYLRALRLEDADLPQISPTLKQRLIAAGFETAADIDARIGEIRGIGQTRFDILIDWRESCERHILQTYDLTVPDQELVKLAKHWRAEVLRRQRAVMDAATELRRAHAAFETFVRRRDLGLEPVARRLGQARADVQVIG